MPFRIARPWLKIVAGTVCGLLATIVVLRLAAMAELVGPATGVEFSPDKFSHRSFWYMTLLGIQVTPKQTHEWHTPLDDYLHQSGFVPTTVQNPPRWHLVKGFQPGVRGWHGTSKYMCWGLGCFNGKEENQKWVDWSKDNPRLADVLWPRVVQWITQEKYDEVLYLFRLGDWTNIKTIRDLETAIAKAEVQAGF